MGDRKQAKVLLHIKCTKQVKLLANHIFNNFMRLN